LATTDNPLLDDRTVSFLLDEVLDLQGHLSLPRFADHDRQSIELLLDMVRKLARRVLYPTWKVQDEHPPELRDGRVHMHPTFHAIWPALVETGLLAAPRPTEHGGQQLPFLVHAVAAAYLGAANLNVVGLLMLTSGAAHLIEAFGDDAQRARWMVPLHEGRWTGTMALTEPQAGSSLGDVQTTARLADDGSYRIRGSKIFISGGDHDLTDNVVNLALARIVQPDGHATAGTRGLSLFIVPRRRPEGDGWVDNDVTTTQLIHKIGWRGLPSIALSFGDRDDCHGWLVGPPGRGMPQMFQMMNEARVGVGVAATATASVAYQESLAYARSRPQGRGPGARDGGAQVDIVEHADVRRMLLRQKAIVEGALALSLTAARLVDRAAHHPDEATRATSQRLLDLLTPIVKSFPAERGFESVALALQIHGGYGYSSEYPVEGWLRDQKLNSIHEGTTGIQGLDLLGRKVVAGGGEALSLLLGELATTAARARASGVDPAWCDQLVAAGEVLGSTTMALGQRGLGGDVEGMLLHSHDFLELASIVVVAWQHLAMATAAREGLRDLGGLSRGGPQPEAFYEGKLRAAQHWIATELPRVPLLAALCVGAESSYASMPADGW
jgi:alkylation response protein AidB-like acyl-CoA dehydrogenase